jgi:hypothetical protein
MVTLKHIHGSLFDRALPAELMARTVLLTYLLLLANLDARNLFRAFSQIAAGAYSMM